VFKLDAMSSDKTRLEIGHVLFIDIVGYSKLLLKQQSELLRELNEIVSGTKEFREAESAGKLIRLPSGDGMALVFRTNAEAPAECATEIAQALKSHPAIQLRMGIHSGPVNEVVDVNQRANIAGAGINMAQRVMDCGDAGHILVSKHVAEDLEQDERWRPLLHDLGTCEVKHGVRVGVTNLYSDELGNSRLPKKIQALRQRKRIGWAAAAMVLLLGAFAVVLLVVRGRAMPSATTVPEKSIAVLPFENLSSDKENAYFAEGIQDEILTRLSKIADLKVISRTSTQHYKSAPQNLPEIGHQLGVAHIVEGSVQKSGDAVRVNVQLIKAANQSHLWADTFDRKLTDIFSVETEVAKAIADQLRAKLIGREEQVIAEKPTSNPQAYDSYLRGLAYSLKSLLTPANSLGAQKYLKEAVRLDPRFAVAWALLSYVDATGYHAATLEPTVPLREEARQAAETALTLEPQLGEAVLAKGHYYYACLKDFETAQRYFEQAHQLLPNSSRIPENLAYLARRQSQWDRSETYFKEAERLDPRNVNLLTQHAILYIDRRQSAEASAKLDQVLNITPDDEGTIALKATVAQSQGDLPRAAALLAPLNPNADDPATLETQVYQAILERQPAQIIARLQDVLIKADPALGYNLGELRFFLGWAQEVAGDHAAAQENWHRALGQLEPLLGEQPENVDTLRDLALIHACLGEKAAAFKLAEQAMKMLPAEKDATNGPLALETLARVAAQTGEPDRAITALQKLLSIPYTAPLTPALLRLDPMFDPLRNDPRFQKLAAGDVSNP
jgi:TolB-like protein/tetratricopeptide (TPR) repeat protein